MPPNSQFKICQTFSEGSAKDKRRISEGKSASWRSRVCDEGKSASLHSRVCNKDKPKISIFSTPNSKFRIQNSQFIIDNQLLTKNFIIATKILTVLCIA